MSRSRFPADLLTRLVAAFRGPVKPAAVHLAVDVPEPQSVSVGTLVIHGWAFSRDGRIVDVQARLGNRSPRALAYGFRRPDVARAFGNPSAEQCGFQATIVFEPTSARVEHLAVRATDERG